MTDCKASIHPSPSADFFGDYSGKEVIFIAMVEMMITNGVFIQKDKML